MSRDVSILYMYIHLFVQILYHAFLLDLQETHQQDVKKEINRIKTHPRYIVAGILPRRTLPTSHFIHHRVVFKREHDSQFVVRNLP